MCTIMKSYSVIPRSCADLNRAVFSREFLKALNSLVREQGAFLNLHLLLWSIRSRTRLLVPVLSVSSWTRLLIAKCWLN